MRTSDAPNSVTSCTKRDADSFIFRLTSVCDKKCVLCCNNYDGIKTSKSAQFDRLISKFADISEYYVSRKRIDITPNIFLTGGEAFLYRSAIKNGTGTLFDVIKAAIEIIPQARIIVKTGGFRSYNKHQRHLFDLIVRAYPRPVIEFRLGFNRYQDTEESALDRFVCTVESVLSYQHFISIDTIYDKENLSNTCNTLEAGLRRMGINVEPNMLLDIVLHDPNEHRRIEIRMPQDAIILDLGPSYAPNKAASVREYYTEPSSACEIIDSGTSTLYYDTNLQLIHCNDSFVDASVPSLRIGNGSISNELEFLNERFSWLNEFIAHENVQFHSRKDRCFFCTKYVMTDAGTS
ncbi:MAG: hypothetical protein ACHQQQ_11750 [Bacteroidota bacterium]